MGGRPGDGLPAAPQRHAHGRAGEGRDAAVAGCMLLAVGNGSVTYVEQRVPTTIVALVIALTPVWMVVKTILCTRMPGSRNCR